MMVDRVCALYIGWGMGSWVVVRTLSLFALNSRLHPLDQAYATDNCLNIMIYLFLISFQFLQIPLDVQCSPFLCLTQCSLAEIELQTWVNFKTWLTCNFPQPLHQFSLVIALCINGEHVNNNWLLNLILNTNWISHFQYWISIESLNFQGTSMHFHVHTINFKARLFVGSKTHLDCILPTFRLNLKKTWFLLSSPG